MEITDLTDEKVEQIIKMRNSPEYYHHFTHNKINSLKSRKLWQNIIDTLHLPWNIYDLKTKYKGFVRSYKKNIIVARTVGNENIKWRFWDVARRNVRFEVDDIYYTIMNIDDDTSVLKIEGCDITNEIVGLRVNVDMLNDEIEKYIYRIKNNGKRKKKRGKNQILMELVKDVEYIKRCIATIMQKIQ